MSDVRYYPDSKAAAEACGEHALSLLERALEARSWATLAVSGGSSPRPMFELFAKRSFLWANVHIFWVDERYVPASDSQSNYGFANQTWLAPAKVPEANIHRIPTSLEPHECARLYSGQVRAVFQALFGLKAGETPQFDVIHRGMGPDGHTASLFPGEALIVDRSVADHLAAAVWVQKMSQWRLTLLPAVLEAARHTVVLATGADKAAALESVLRGPEDPLNWPAQIAARESSRATWYLDQAAAERLGDLSKAAPLPKD